MLRWAFRAALLSGLLGLSACGSKDDGGSTSDDFASKLQGTWKTGCIEFDATTHSIATRVYNGNQDSLDLIVYGDDKCLLSIYGWHYEDTFAITGDADGLTDTKKIDRTLTRYKFSLTSDDAVTEANKEKYYGYDDWKLNESKDIDGKKLSDSDDAEAAIGSKAFGIAKVTADTPPKLLTGDTDSGDGTSEDKRPKSLSETIVYAKQ